jgi:hypothetical protein
LVGFERYERAEEVDHLDVDGVEGAGLDVDEHVWRRPEAFEFTSSWDFNDGRCEA